MTIVVDCSELKRLAQDLIEYDSKPNDGHTGWDEICAPEAWHELHSALSPEDVLAIASDIEQSREGARSAIDAFQKTMASKMDDIETIAALRKENYRLCEEIKALRKVTP